MEITDETWRLLGIGQEVISTIVEETEKLQQYGHGWRWMVKRGSETAVEPRVPGKKRKHAEKERKAEETEESK